ncbi:hypothetical protein ACFL6C_07635 [Myxococcota bacterium]
MMDLPSCGLYRTTIPIGEVPAGRLVYFHNHGDPGPGIYLPQAWRANRAVFDKRGTVLDDPALSGTLESLPAEGLYRVLEPFTCCSKQCRLFEEGLLVQLGYNGKGEPLLFVPHWHADGLHIPERGFKLEEARFGRLQRLKVEDPALDMKASELQ